MSSTKLNCLEEYSKQGAISTFFNKGYEPKLTKALFGGIVTLFFSSILVHFENYEKLVFLIKKHFYDRGA